MIQMASSQILFTFLIFLFHFQHSSSFSLSVEKPKQDIIVSPKGTFTAGFYPVGENAYSFAIWFTQKHTNIYNATVVWMANRDQPVNGKRSTLSLLKTGNLVLTDAGYSNVWSTNTNSSKPLEVFLSDTGNLILREHSKNDFILWQSFDFPTDTLLPNQIFAGYMNLVSSKSVTNYSSGFYKLFFNSIDFLILLYDGPMFSNIYWYGFQSNSRVAKLDVLGNFSSSDVNSLITSDYGTVLQRRLTLDFDGNVRVYSRKHGQEKWSISGQFNQQPIKIYGICGPDSFCINNPENGRKCVCIPGYSRIDYQDWSQGCKPTFQLSCNNETKLETRFQRLSHIQFEYNSYEKADYYYQANYTYKQCKHFCLRMCQCIAFEYSLAQYEDSYEDSYDCYMKTQLQNGYSSPDFQGSTFLRLPKRKHVFLRENVRNDDSLVCSRNNGVKQLSRSYVEGKENGSVKFMIWFVTGLGVIEVLCFFMAGCFLYKNRKPSSVDNHENILAAAIGFKKFSYSELKQATADFREEIGKGAGGTVYKGVLSDNRAVAIKCLHEANQGESESEFLAEASIIGRLNHLNLIGMWGYCAEGKHRLLVYEYMEKGTLADNLSSNELDWGKRYNIAMGTAKGLAYLHEKCLEWILHCDIKPQNILIDSDYNPKVADFGLSKLLQRNNFDNSCISRMRGTRGYMAPDVGNKTFMFRKSVDEYWRF